MLLRKQKNRVLDRSAFTLMEMLVVVAIIVALAGVGVIGFLQYQKSAMLRIARAQAMELTKACEAFATNHNGVYPSQLGELLVDDGVGGPYLKKVTALRDPWGGEFVMDPAGSRNAAAGATIRIPDIFTRGPDGQEIGNW